MNKTRIMIVDDHPLLRRGLSLLLNQEADMMVCGEHNTAEEALASFEQDMPDFIILDITMSASGMTGLDFIKQVRAQYPKLFILVLSIHEECIYAERSVKAGANGYLLKQEPAEKVVIALRQVMEGNLVLSDKILQSLLRRYLTDTASEAGPDIGRLSNREYEVLRLIGEGMQPQQIAERLDISTKTVETHRFNIRKKLHFRRASELIQFAIRHVHNGDPIY